jgi:hypothetical protein
MKLLGRVWNKIKAVLGKRTKIHDAVKSIGKPSGIHKALMNKVHEVAQSATPAVQNAVQKVGSMMNQMRTG